MFICQSSLRTPLTGSMARAIRAFDPAHGVDGPLIRGVGRVAGKRAEQMSDRGGGGRSTDQEALWAGPV